MSIKLALELIEKMKNDQKFSQSVLLCKNAETRIKLIESAGYSFTIAEIVKEIGSVKYNENRKKDSNDWKWLEIVAIWSIDRRNGWRGDILDRSVRGFLNTKSSKILCPKCSETYYVSDDFEGRYLECEICNNVFKVKLIKTSVNIHSPVPKPDSENVISTVEISKNNIWKNWK